MGKNKPEAGRPMNFETPEQLWEVWEQYKSTLKEKAKEYPKIQYVGKDGIQKTDYPKVPMTLAGFNVFSFKNGTGLVDDYFHSSDERYSNFSGICRAIKQEIREDQIIGGMAGLYNPSITQRLQGLSDKKEIEGTTTSILKVDPLDNEE